MHPTPLTMNIRPTFILLFLLLSTTVYAQMPLSTSDRTGHTKALYRITDAEALKIFRAALLDVNFEEDNYDDENDPPMAREFDCDETLLHTFITSWNDKKRRPVDIPTGNYITVYGDGTKLIYDYTPVNNVRMHLLENQHDLLLTFSDMQQRPVSDARVSFNNKKIPYNTAAHQYILKGTHKGGVIKVQYNGVTNYFYAKRKKDRYRSYSATSYFGRKYKQLKRFFRFKHHSGRQDRFSGYMVFNKPMFKPGDTIRMKAFLLDHNNQPVNETLDLHLQGRDEDTILTRISPYRPGAYEFAFRQNDSLHMKLDYTYSMLLAPTDKKRYNTGFGRSFKYEAYELSQLTFKIRSDEENYHTGTPVKIFMKGTDENELPILDGRVSVEVTTNYTSNYNLGATFIPEKLYATEIPLEPVGETILTLPDSIFPKADISFTVRCFLKSSSNDTKSASLSLQHTKDDSFIRMEKIADSLQITYEKNGKSVPMPAEIIMNDTEDDSIGHMQVQLPTKIPINPYVASYDAETADATENFELNEKESGISLNAQLIKDSVFVKMFNPSQIPVWYQVYAGNKKVHGGYGTSLQWSDKAWSNRHYIVQAQYVYGGKSFKESATAYYTPNNLSVTINAPDVVQPGGKAALTVQVRDYQDRPIKDADVTAYAFTSKFKSMDPVIPYLGKSTAKFRKAKLGYITPEEISYNDKGPLNWSKWKDVLGLDTMPFFHFFHPEKVLYNFEPSLNNVTQLAPFAVKNGVPQIPHLIWIDDDLVYVHGTTTIGDYSFQVIPRRHTVRIRTAHEEVLVDSVFVPYGKKTFISINLDQPSEGVHITPKKDTFSLSEKYLIDNKLILLQPTGKSTPQYLFNNNKALQIEPDYMTPAIIGPVANSLSLYYAAGTVNQWFQPEANNLFIISNGLIKQREAHISGTYLRGKLKSELEFPSLKDMVRRPADIDSLYKVNLEYTAIRRQEIGTSNLKLLLNRSFRDSIRQVFIYKTNDSTWLTLTDGNVESISGTSEGQYKILILMHNSGYVKLENLEVKKGCQSIYNFVSPIINPETDSIRKMRSLLDLSLIEESKGAPFLQIPVLKSIPAHNNYSSPADIRLSDSKLTKIIQGKVTDDKGVGIPGVTIHILGYQNGAQTDANGMYKMAVTPTGTLVFSFVGYETRQVSITASNIYNVTMSEVSKALQEVVVTGYGIQKKANLSYSVSTVKIETYSLMSGKAAGIAIRGTSSLGMSGTPLIVIDGVPYTGKLEDLDPDAVANIVVLKTVQATALYGSRAADGAVVITSNGKKVIGKKKNTIDGSESERKIALRHNFRDDAFWQPRLRTNENGEAHFDVTYPDDLTSWKTYALAMTDNKMSGSATTVTKAFRTLSASLALPQFVIAGDTLGVLTKVMNYKGDSIALDRSLLINKQVIKEGDIQLRNSRIEVTPVAVPAADSLRATFQVTNRVTMDDGEYKAIPVMPAGTTETTGKFFLLRGDTNFVIPPSGDTSALHVFASTSAMPVLLEEVQHLRKYEYLCNEQTASKLMAFLLQKKWAERFDSAFNYDNDIRKLIELLDNRRNNDGLWGWWSGGQSSEWISAHVLKALKMADDAKFKSSSYNKDLLRLLVPRTDKYNNDFDAKLFVLEMYKDIDPAFNLVPYLDTISLTKLKPYQSLQLMELKQRAGMKVNTSFLTTHVQHTMLGNTFWGDEGLFFLGDRMQTTLRAYRILKAEGGHEELLRSTRAWILEQRGIRCWRNTYESATILESIWDDVARENETTPPKLRINNTDITNFPYKAEFPGNTALAVNRSGGRTIYFNAWQQHHNPQPTVKDGAFLLRSWFQQKGDTVKTLHGGEPVTLKVNVEVTADAEYVMIEVPIPAGCSYNGKPQSYWGSEVHREYNYHKVSIFCQQLRKGQHVFSIELMPRYSGTFQLNPARAELMYFPVFYGHEGMKSIQIR